MWFSKKELTVEEIIELLEKNSEKINNHLAEKIMIIVAKSGANKITHFTVSQ